jgi:hypothetical protein
LGITSIFDTKEVPTPGEVDNTMKPLKNTHLIFISLFFQF